MAFPVNGIIDDFNRAGEGPPPSASWTDKIITTDGVMSVNANAAIGADPVNVNSAWWSAATFGPDCEAYVTRAEATDFGGVMLRLQAPGTSGVDGYYGQFYETGQQLFIKRLDNAVETVLLTVNSFNPAVGDSIGLSAIGSTIELWYKVGAGAWTSKGSVTDSSYSGAGYMGIAVFGSFRLDDFGGGTIASLSPGTATLTLTTFAPSLALAVIPARFSLETTSFAPTVNVTVSAVPDTASLVLTGFAPIVNAGGNLTLQPVTLALELIVSGFAPTVNISDHIVVSPGVQALNLTGFAPVVDAGGSITLQPGTLSVFLNGFAPGVLTGALDASPDRTFSVRSDGRITYVEADVRIAT